MIDFLPYIIFRTTLSSANSSGSFRSRKFNEALFIASRNIFYLKKDKVNLLKKKLNLTIFKYHTRSKYRCEPFGLFAGYGVANWGNTNKIIISDKINRKTSLDLGFLHLIGYNLSINTVIIKHLKFQTNNTTYKLNDYFVFYNFEYIYNKRNLTTKKIQSNDQIEKIISFFKKESHLEEFIEFCSKEKKNSTNILLFLISLVKIGLLVSELQPEIIEEDYLRKLIIKLNEINKKQTISGLHNLIKSLNYINNKLNEIDNSSSNSIKIYEEIISKISKLQIPHDKNKLFNVNISFDALNGQIHSALKDELKFVITQLSKIQKNTTNSDLDNFITKFKLKYRSRVVPFLEALNEEIGIGYTQNNSNLTEYQTFEKLNKFEQHLYWKLVVLNKSKDKILKLTKKDFELNDNIEWDKFPATIAIMFKILDCKENKILFKYAGESSAGSLISRFGQFDSKIKDILEQIDVKEETTFEEKLNTEIVTLRDNSTDNILLRPRFRKHEIPIISSSSNIDKINLDDLYISIRNNKIHLFSKSLNKEIIPKITTALNFSDESFHIYKFLFDLQFQDKFRSISYSWGNLKYYFNYFPRVYIKRTIVSPSLWRFVYNDFSVFYNKNEVDLLALMNKFRKINSIPNIIILIHRGTDIVFNLNNKSEIYYFLDMLSSKSEIWIKEYLKPKNYLISTNNSFKRESDCIAMASINAKTDLISKHEISKTISLSNSNRNFEIGTEWLTFKLYCDPINSENIFLCFIENLLKELNSLKIIKKWFYLVFNDPSFHIRLRLNSSEKNIVTIIKIFNKHYDKFNKNQISDLIIDSYEQELERFYYIDIKIIEYYFYVDTLVISRIIKFLNEKQIPNYTYGAFLINIDKIFCDFQFSLSDRINILKAMKEYVIESINLKKDEIKNYTQNRRNNKIYIYNLFDSTSYFGSEFKILHDVFHQRTDYTKFIIFKNKLTNENIVSLVSTVIHLSYNRLLISKYRFDEFDIYDSLLNYYIFKVKTNNK